MLGIDPPLAPTPHNTAEATTVVQVPVKVLRTEACAAAFVQLRLAFASALGHGERLARNRAEQHPMLGVAVVRARSIAPFFVSVLDLTSGGRVCIERGTLIRRQLTFGARALRNDRSLRPPAHPRQWVVCFCSFSHRLCGGCRGDNMVGAPAGNG